ncbi:MAG: hypothetical protein HY300_00410 [Verrucomicrobia bacterium]|nr:hypothetical protein [Verrucomicrobiota bacterium]
MQTFTTFMDERPSVEKKEGDAVCCPVCGYPTLSERLSYQICCLCWWEDEWIEDSIDTKGRANCGYSIREARENFERYLTKYGPNNEPRFSETRKLNHLKKVFMALIDAYRVERGCAPMLFHRQARARILWKSAKYFCRFL